MATDPAVQELTVYDHPQSGYGYYHHTPYFGAGQQPQQNALQGLGYILGGLGTGAASSALQDPTVQAAIEDVKVQCQERAKTGVNEWVKENWPALAFAGLCMLIGNYVTVSIALLQAGVRGKRLKALSRLPGT